MLKTQHPTDYLKKEGEVTGLPEKQQNSKSFQPKSRVRRQYNPDDTNIAKLFLAIREHKVGNPELDKTNAIKELLTKIHNINDVDLNDAGNTPLHVAVSKKHQDIVELLLNATGIDPNIKNNQGDTPLHIAVSEGNEELVRLLLSKKAEVNVKNNDGKTPLDIANRLKRQDIVEILESHIQLPSTQQKRTRTNPEEDSNSKRRRISSQAVEESRETKRKQSEGDDPEGSKKRKKVHEGDSRLLLSRKKFVDAKKLSDEARKEFSKKDDLRLRIDKRKSLSEAGKRYLEEVERSIKEGRDVNFVGKGGNTFLHDAVEDGCLEVVEYLLRKGAIVSKENSKNETALDIAIKLNEEDIVKALGKEIVNNSLKELEKESQRLTSSNALNKKKEEGIEERIKGKIEFSLKALTELTKDEKDIRKFTYKNVNIFVLFLEAFALQDVEINQKLSEDKKNKLIEQYFGEEDNKIIKSIRGKYTHREKEEIFSPLYLENFVFKTSRKLDVGKFFNDLKDYVQGVYDKLNKQQSGLNKKDIKEILQPTSESKKKNKKTIPDLFSDLVKVAYNKNSKSEEQDKAMFDLTVNIIPLIGGDLKKEFKELGDLRNELIHNFHKFSSVTSRMNELTRTMFYLRSKIFKYYSSEKIYNKLHGTQPGQETDSIIVDISKELESFAKEFCQKFLTLSEGEAKGSFENVFSESLFSEKDGDIRDLINKYLRFMAVIDDEKRGLIDDEESEISEHYRELNDVERREIFEGFLELEEIFKKTKEKEFYEKQEKLKERCGEYGIEESSFDKVIKLLVEGSNVFDKEVEDKITSIVKGLKSLKHSKELQEYTLSDQDIISLRNHFMKEKDIFHLSNHENLLRNCRFSDDAEQLIEEKFSYLTKEDKTTNVSSVGVQINVAKVVNNILNTFYNAYHKYQIKFDNIEGAFSDKIFLDFLVSRDVELDRVQQSFNFKNEDYIFRIIKKLLKKEYTAPYIASLIIKVQSDSVIEKDDLRRLIEILLKKDAYIPYLDELLCVKSKEPSLYEAAFEVLEKVEVNAENLRIILSNSKHAREILDILGKKIDSANGYTSSNPSSDRMIGLTKKLLKLLNSVALELIYKGKHEEALEVLDSKDKSNSSKSKGQSVYQKLVSKELIKESDDLIIDNQLSIAKAKNAQGEKKEKEGNNKEAESLYEEALGVLQEIPNTNSPGSLLALSRKGYTHSLLKQYDKSYEEHNKLYNEVKKHALGEASTTKPDSKEIYTEIKKSEKYQELLNSSDECGKYLNIASLRKSIAYSKLQQGKYSKSIQEALKDYEEALKIYSEVLSLQKEDSGEEYKSILPTRKKIAFLHSKIGSEKIALKDYKSALEHYYHALEEENKISKREIEIYGNYYSGIEKGKRYIKQILLSIDKIKPDKTIQSKKKLLERHLLSSEQCLLSTSSGRNKREAIGEKCLFTWEDVDEFNEEKDERSDLSKIKIDSEKFVSYIKDLPEEKQSQLIQLAGGVKVTGESQSLVNKLIGNQKVMNHLSRVGKISGMTMHGMMAKNVLADFLNGNYQGVAINVGFIAGGQGFAKVAEAASLKGLELASEGKLLLGRSLRAASPFLARGTSAFVVYDLVNQVKAFKNGTEEALVGVVGDSIYLGVDAAEIGVEVAEAFGVLETPVMD